MFPNMKGAVYVNNNNNTKGYSETSGIQEPCFCPAVATIDRYSLKKAFVQNCNWLWFYVGKICRVTWILLHWILYCNSWCPGITNTKINLFCQNWAVLQKSCWSMVSIGEFFLNMQKGKHMCGEKYIQIRGPLSTPLTTYLYILTSF